MLDQLPIPGDVAFLSEAVRSAPSADNTQPWSLSWDGAELCARVAHGDPMPADEPATLMAIGAAGENLSYALREAAIDGAPGWWIGLPAADGVFARGPVVAREPVRAREDEDTEAAALGGAGSPAPVWQRRHTNRYPYRRDLPAGALEALADCRVGDCQVVVLPGAALARAARWVRAASEVRFRTRELNEWFAAILRFDRTSNLDSGLHVSTLALPPGGATLARVLSVPSRMEWANRLGIYKLLAAVEAGNFRKAPAALAVVGPPGHAAVFDAGRCLQRAWLIATELGLSGHPYYVVADLLHRLESGRVPTACVGLAESVRARVRAEYGAGRTLHCLLRVGIPVRTGPVSGRRALHEVLSVGDAARSRGSLC